MVRVQPRERELFSEDASRRNKPPTTRAQASSETWTAPVCGVGRAIETRAAPASRESPDIGVFLQAWVVWVSRDARQGAAGVVWVSCNARQGVAGVVWVSRGAQEGAAAWPWVPTWSGVWCLPCLVALFFFCGVGVVDDEVVEAEGVGCFGGGDQAVDGLGFSGEGVGGSACPGGG